MKGEKVRFSISRDLSNLSVTWTDKKTGRIFGVATDDIEAALAPAATDFFTCYGMQKFVEDRTSGVPADDKLDEREELWTMICEHGHEWKKEREGGGPTVRVEVQALANLQGCSVAAIQKALRGKDAEYKAKVFGNAKVREEVKRIQEAEEAASVDLDSLAS